MRLIDADALINRIVFHMDWTFDEKEAFEDVINEEPSVQPEPSTDIQDVLGYLDDVLHPLISPDNWNVYSELHDMISRLPSAQSEHPKGYWIKKISKEEKNKKYTGYTPYWYCSKCGKKYEPALANTIINYCYNCGAKMEGGRMK